MRRGQFTPSLSEPYNRALRRVSLFFYLLLACGCSVVDDRCPTPPAQADGTYFPLVVGQTWVFDYRNVEAVIPSLTETTGPLTWTVTSEQCETDRHVYRIEEAFNGRAVTTNGDFTSEQPASWTKTLTFTIGDDLDLDGYSAAPFPWRYPSTAPDTVAVNQAACLSETGCLEITLVRGTGLVRHTRDRHLFASASSSTALTLVSVRTN